MIQEIIRKAKKENKKVYVYAHQFPDGDAISSSCAIVEYLKNNGVEAKYVVDQQVRSYTEIVGEIPVTRSVEKDAISVILDTSTVDYAQNQLFKNSSTENTYIIDHHEKTKDTKCIEDELNIPSKNVIRNPNSSSTCEILVNELQQETITPQIADMLTLGLITDTAKLKFLKEDTLQNLSKLIKAGANYENIRELCNRKIWLRQEVGMAKILLKTLRFKIGDTYGLILPINNKQVKNLSKQYGIRSPQKKIFKMADIENCGFNCIVAENNPNIFDADFRSYKRYGNFNVFQLANQNGGGGHYNAAGCSYKIDNQQQILPMIMDQVISMYSEQGKNIPKITENEYDKKLDSILTKTDKLKKGVTPQILSQVDELIKNGANYEHIYAKPKPYKIFRLENEILSRISNDKLFQKQPTVNIYLSTIDTQALTQRYNVKEDDILKVIEVFRNIDVKAASIVLPNERKAQISQDGEITISDIKSKEENKNSTIEK